MSPQELKSTVSLSLVFVFRMFGLFMVLPVLVLYSEDLQGATPALAGFAIGAYGLTQAALQIPFGWMSDRFGRKPVIIVGMMIFMLGSLVAAQADSMYGVIFGRILQGAGAVAGAITALLADLTREQYRTRAMAVFGISIGFSFCIAMLLGPLFASWWGLEGLFGSNAVMAGLGILILLFMVPTPVVTRTDLNTKVRIKDVGNVISNPQMLRLMAGIFTLHFTLMALFVFLPQMLEDTLGMAREKHGWVYIVALSVSFVMIVPVIIFSEAKRRLKQCFVGAVTVLLAAIAGMWRVDSVLLGIFLFFAAFNFLEATLPSLVSKLSSAGTRGTSMGVYSTSQFLGAALGGSLGGLAFQYWGATGVMMVCAIPTALWWLLSVTMKQPPYVSSMVMALDSSMSLDARAIGRELAIIPGVEEVTVLDSERTAYLKVDRKIVDMTALRQYGEC
ncbi:MFS transporter [Endozoicomonas sp. 4G]|uniref:MFS transporter n=1 Tax=Endozoicomonas sp. 4G TaxID=2872754 RepID=UPI0020786721|nr:MFS transporter [Endozoicomonas sp. 4G]